MALEFHCGFDYFNNTAEMEQGIWTFVEGGIQTGNPRNGAKSFYSLGTTYRAGLSNAVTRVIGMGFMMEAIGPYAGHVFSVGDDGATGARAQVVLSIDNAGRLIVNRGGSSYTQLAISENVLLGEVWYFVEMVVSHHPISGTVDVFVNDDRWINIPATNTAPTGRSSSNVVAILYCGPYANYDDFYTVTGASPAPSARLGDCKSVLKPAQRDSTAGPGFYGESTPSSSTDRGAMVDDLLPDENTTHNAFLEAGQRDSYKTKPLGLNGIIHGMSVRHRLRRSDAGIGAMQHGVRSGTTDVLSANVFPSDASYAWFSTIFGQDPNTGGEWTVQALDAAQPLVKRTI